MSYSARSRLAFILVFVSMSVGTQYEISVSRTTGISLEHILISLSLLTILHKIKLKSAQEFAFIVILFCCVYALMQTQITMNSLHVISFFILASQFLFYNSLSEDDLRKLVLISILLLFIQVLFFRNTGTAWDNITIPGFGVVQRLAILGFVSNSLAVMCLPFIIFLIYSPENKLIKWFFIPTLCLIVLLTASRVGVVLLLIIFVIKFRFKIVVPALLASIILWYYLDFSKYLQTIEYVVIRGGVINNPRAAIWIENLSQMDIFDFMVGKGFMLHASDNTLVSVIYGGGVFITLILILAILSIINFRNFTYPPILTLFLVFILCILTFDVFSQRKLLFTFCIVGSYFCVREKENTYP